MNCIKTEYFFRKGEEGTQKLTHLNVVLGSTIIYASDHCGTVYIFFINNNVKLVLLQLWDVLFWFYEGQSPILIKLFVAISKQKLITLQRAETSNRQS